MSFWGGVGSFFLSFCFAKLVNRMIITVVQSKLCILFIFITFREILWKGLQSTLHIISQLSIIQWMIIAGPSNVQYWTDEAAFMSALISSAHYLIINATLTWFDSIWPGLRQTMTFPSVIICDAGFNSSNNLVYNTRCQFIANKAYTVDSF